MDITEIDGNFTVPVPKTGDTHFFDVSAPPFRVYGLLRDDAGYFRMPRTAASAVNPGVKELNAHTAGGRVRFKTDADRICLRVQLRSVAVMPHFALTGSAGFDLYADNVFCGAFFPPVNPKKGYKGELRLPGGEKQLREITVHFPLYAGVVKLELGFPAGSRIAAPRPYAIEKPAVYYGSSITQGGCASRPGNAYQNILSRILDCDHVNLGFSGSAKGEQTMAAYIAGLTMSAFILDYDHNAPDTDHLQATHAPFFRTVRKANPTLPVIMLSRPQPNPCEDDIKRRAIIRATFAAARAAGDDNVYFIDGETLLRRFGGDSGTVDTCHPNDLGFFCMAEGLRPVLAQAILQK